MEIEAQFAVALDLKYLSAALHNQVGQELYQVLGLLNRLIEAIRRKRAG